MKTSRLVALTAALAVLVVFSFVPGGVTTASANFCVCAADCNAVTGQCDSAPGTLHRCEHTGSFMNPSCNVGCFPCGFVATPFC